VRTPGAASTFERMREPKEAADRVQGRSPRLARTKPATGGNDSKPTTSPEAPLSAAQIQKRADRRLLPDRGEHDSHISGLIVSNTPRCVAHGYRSSRRSG